MGESLTSSSIENTLDGSGGNGRLCPCCSFSSDLFLPRSMTSRDMPLSGISIGSSEEGPVSINPHDALAQIIDQENDQEDNYRVKMVDTHGHPHLSRERQSEYISATTTSNSFSKQNVMVSLTCGVAEADWDSALEYAASSRSILPALGVHPWYLEDLTDDWLHKLECLLKLHPCALVGEIGLCKMARNVRSHPDGKAAGMLRQRNVFADQMRLAARLRRPVSVHCVKQHGVLLSVLQDIQQKAASTGIGEASSAFPPAVALHSFTGTAHQVKQMLAFEKTILPAGSNPLFYFGFSHAVNVVMCTSDKSKRQGQEAIRAVPLNRILAESDVHAKEDVPLGTAGAIANIASALEMPIIEVAKETTANGISFLSTIREASLFIGDD